MQDKVLERLFKMSIDALNRLILLLRGKRGDCFFLQIQATTRLDTACES